MKHSIVYPSYYTSAEGGKFRRWRGLPVTVRMLLQLRKKPRGGLNYVEIGGMAVHALAFGILDEGKQYYARWDCINGWTTTLYKAKQNFLRSLYHGEQSGS